MPDGLYSAWRIWKPAWRNIGSISQVNVLYSWRRCVSSSSRVQPSSGLLAAPANQARNGSLRLIWLEGEDQVAQQQQAAWAQDAGDALQRERLPEIRQMVQGVA